MGGRGYTLPILSLLCFLPLSFERWESLRGQVDTGHREDSRDGSPCAWEIMKPLEGREQEFPWFIVTEMQTRRFWKKKEEEIPSEGSVARSASSSLGPVCPPLPAGALRPSLLLQVRVKAPSLCPLPPRGCDGPHVTPCPLGFILRPRLVYLFYLELSRCFVGRKIRMG